MPRRAWQLAEPSPTPSRFTVLSTPRMLRFGALFSVLAMACGGSSIALSDLDQALQQARCERQARCKLFSDEAACMAVFRALPDASVAGAIAAHKARYDGERARQCVDATAAQSCDLTAHDSHIAPAACTEMFTGTLAGGDSCSIDAECASGTCDLPTTCPEGGCCVGACRPVQAPGKAGDACAKDHDCVGGLVCGQDLTCRAPAKADEPCSSDRECGDGLACVGAGGTVLGMCNALPHGGAICPYQRCSEANLRCDDASMHICVPVGLAGDPCPTSTECAIGTECDASTHVCREFPSLGMPCDGSCTSDGFCSIADGAVSGTCLALLANNMPCDGNQQCGSGFCEDGPVFRSCIDPYVCF
jgi:hypothetical protein